MNFCRYFVLFISMIATSQAQYLKIIEAKIEIKPTYAVVSCNGKTALPDNAKLQISFFRHIPGNKRRSLVLNAMVKKGRFSMRHRSHSLFPGSYRVVVFFSSQLQPLHRQMKPWGIEFSAANWQNIFLESVGFTETEKLIYAGTPEQYQKIYGEQKQWLQSTLREIKDNFAGNYRLHQESAKRRDLAFWRKQSKRREQFVDSIRERCELQRGRYRRFFFPDSYQQLCAMINLIEMYNEMADVHLAENLDKYYKIRLRQFSNRYLKAQRDFDYYAVLLAPKSEQKLLFLKQIENYKEFWQKQKSKSEPENLQQLIMTILRLGHYHKNIPHPGPEFIMRNSLWLREIRQYSDELLLGEDPNIFCETPPISREICSLFLVLLDDRQKRFDGQETSNFLLYQQKILQKKSAKNIVGKSLSLEYFRLKHQLEDLDKNKFIIDPQKMHDWKITLLKQQNLHMRLIALEPENQKLLTEYICICTYFLNYYHMIEIHGERSPVLEQQRQILARQLDILGKLLEKK